MNNSPENPSFKIRQKGLKSNLKAKLNKTEKN